MDRLTAGIEIGGTKTVVILARGQDVVAMRRYPTTTPDETLEACIATLATWQAEHGRPTALGIGSFGPLDLRAGRITNTTKLGWSGTDLIDRLADLGLSTALDTDVNAAALAEQRWGAAVGTEVSLYMTIGTGVGVGLIVNGSPVHGLVHPEAGHVLVTASDGSQGTCPFHGSCLEGLASGPAVRARTGAPAESLDGDHPIWRHVAAEIGDVLATMMLLVSPERIVIGGGVGLGRADVLLPAVRRHVLDRLGGYVDAVTHTTIQSIIRPAQLGSLSGALGAASLPLET